MRKTSENSSAKLTKLILPSRVTLMILYNVSGALVGAQFEPCDS